jgi:hypothetical protein
LILFAFFIFFFLFFIIVLATIVKAMLDFIEDLKKLLDVFILKVVRVQANSSLKDLFTRLFVYLSKNLEQVKASSLPYSVEMLKPLELITEFTRAKVAFFTSIMWAGLDFCLLLFDHYDLLPRLLDLVIDFCSAWLGLDSFDLPFYLG